MAESTAHINDLFGDLPATAAPAVSVTRRLAEDGHEAYLVGGAVRDLALDLVPGDFDVATSARPDAVLDLLPDARLVGAAFGVVLAKVDDTTVEVATFRREGRYSDGRRPDEVVYAGSVAEDARRRDFTVNALYLDPATGLVHDHVDGLADCRARILRTVGEPSDRFDEDGLRLLRAARLAAACALEPAPDTLAALATCGDRIGAVSPERVADELTRMLLGPAPARAFALLRETGLLARVLPEVDALHGTPQPPDHHPEGDVWVHTLLMLEAMETDDAALAWSVLLHDVGKPAALGRDRGRIRFIGHERIGEEMARDILSRLRLSRAVTEKTAALVRGHMQFFDAPVMRPSTLKRFLRRPHFTERLELHRLDKLGSDGNLATWEFAHARRAELNEAELSPAPLLDGDDLIALGVPPGPGLGELLEALETEQLEGRLTDAEAARAWVLRKLGD